MSEGEGEGRSLNKLRTVAVGLPARLLSRSVETTGTALCCGEKGRMLVNNANTVFTVFVETDICNYLYVVL